MDLTPAERGGVFLAIVEGAFNIEGLGCVLVPGVPYPDERIPVLRRGHSIILRRPDGSELATNISQFEMIRRGEPIPFTPISLPKPITAAEVPAGSELWYFATAADHRGAQPGA